MLLHPATRLLALLTFSCPAMFALFDRSIMAALLSTERDWLALGF
jgi:hypothetical protein